MIRLLMALTVIPVASVVTGCAEWNHSLAKDTGQSSPAHADASSLAGDSAQAPLSADEAEEPPLDGSTIEAVREYLADLETATHNDQPSTAKPTAAKQTSIDADKAHPSPLPHDTHNTRVNESLVLASRENDERGESKQPAKPVVLAVSLVGDVDGSSLQMPSEEMPTLGVHRGLDTAIPSHQITLRRLIEQAHSRSAKDPTSAEKQWQLSLLQLAADRSEDATEISPAIAQESRVMISRLVSTVISARRWLDDPVSGSGSALAAVEDLRAMLREEAELLIPVVALCTKVTTFGIYDELLPQAFSPHQANRVIVYCEVKNFLSEPDNSGRFHTLLSARLELFTDDGRSLWTREENKIEDFSRQYREDFFLAQLVTFPSGMAPGDYILKITITDLLASKANEGVHRFSIPGSNANRLTSG